MKANQTARILSKGKSFEFSKWQPFIQYTNDCFKQDFVSYDNALLVCIKTHLSTSDEPPTLLYENPNNPYAITGVDSENWDYIMSGTPGLVYIPEYDDDTGMLHWRTSAAPEDLNPIRIKMQGPWIDSKGENSASLGSLNKTNADYAIASGFESEANGDYSAVFGYKTKTTNSCEVSFGKFNQSIDEQTLFSIGNGTSDSDRKNILEIRFDGSFYYNGQKKDFLTYKEIDDLIGVETQRAIDVEKILSKKIDLLAESAEIIREELIKQINNEIIRSTSKDSEFDQTAKYVTVLIDNDKNKSVRSIAIEEINKIIDGAPDAFNTLKEISDYIGNHGKDVIQMQNDITMLKNSITWAEFD